MLNNSDLLNAIVDHLRSIPELVELVGGADNIIAYDDNHPKFMNSRAALTDMPTPSLMVMWMQTGPRNFQNRELWGHDFTGTFKAIGQASKLLAAFVNGVPTIGCGERMLYTEVIPGLVYSMDVPTMGRRQLMLNETQSMDYMEIQFSYVEKGS